MRRLLALSVVILALVAWLAFASRRGTRQELTVPTPSSSASAKLPPTSATDLDPTSGIDATTRNPQAVREGLDPPSTPKCRVFARVVDSRGAAIESARVTLRVLADQSRKQESFESVTGADGRFLVEVSSPAHEARLRVVASEFLSVGERAFGTSFGQELRKLVPGDNDLGEIALSACGVLDGRVISDAGMAIPNARISYYAATFTDSERTADDGRYRIAHLTAGRYALRLEAGEWMSSEKVIVDVVEMHLTAVRDIVAQRAATITGVVVDESGAPAAKLGIQARTKDKSAQTSTRSGADGSFTLYLQKAEPHMLEIKSSEFQPFGGAALDPRCTFEPGTSGVRIVLTRAPGMTFRVIDGATRAPIEHFGIRVAQRDPPNVTSTRHQLEIALEAHPGGEARLPVIGDSVVAVTAPAHADVEIPFVLDAGSKDVQTIALSLASGITGRVRLGHKPVTRAAVQLCRDTFDADRMPSKLPSRLGKNMRGDVENFPGRPRSLDTADGGQFRFTNLAAGTYALSIESEGSGKKWLRMLVVPPEDILRLGDIDLDPEAVVRGVMITGPGESPIGFELQPEGRMTHTIQGADGKFELRGLSPGPFSFYWNRPDANVGTWEGDPKRLEFDLHAGETREIVIDASQSAPCTLRVRVHRSGQPAADVAVNARIHTQVDGKGWRSSLLATTDATGLAVGRVEGAARVTVEVLSSAKRSIARTRVPIDTVAGGDYSCSIDIAVGTLTVELPATIVAPEHGRVTLSIGDETMSSASTGPARADRQPVWATSTIEFGEWTVGSYDAELRFQRFERDTTSDNPKAGKWVALRDAFKARIEIKEGQATRVVVP